ncbi:extracellular solute-binding protein [Paenibacillus sp. NPDC058898]|uniref:extracellular solute-binding protein n=2 Tax=unclassified Paenibacillus TaxID=185978 RepID=UPI003BF619A9
MLGKRKGVLLLTILLLITSMLAACGSDNSSQGSSSEGTSSTGSASKDPIKLVLWNTWTDEAAEGKAAKARVEAFNASQEGITIEMQTTTHDQYKTKLKTQAAGKQLPELFQVWPGAELEPLAAGGVLLPIDEIKSNWSDLIADDIMAEYGHDGKQYAVPGTMSYTSLIFYDKDMLKAAGYDVFPDTYADFKDMIAKLVEGGTTPIQLGNKGQWVLQSVYLSTIADRATGSDYLTKVLDGSATFSDPQFLQGLSIIQEMTSLKAFNEDMNTLDDFQARDNFIQGKGAMFFGGSWDVGPILEVKPEGKNIGVARFPVLEGGLGKAENVSGVSSVGIALNADLSSEEKEAAFAFLKYFYSEELYANLVLDGLMIPANIEIPEGVSEVTKEVIEATNDGKAPVYDSVLPPTVISVLNNGLQAITLGTITPEQLASDMQKELQVP